MDKDLVFVEGSCYLKERSIDGVSLEDWETILPLLEIIFIKDGEYSSFNRLVIKGMARIAFKAKLVQMNNGVMDITFYYDTNDNENIRIVKQNPNDSSAFGIYFDNILLSDL